MNRHTEHRVFAWPLWLLATWILIVAVSAVPMAHAQSLPEAEYYRSEPLPLPKALVLEVSGMARFGEDRVVVCTRRGELYLVSNPWGPLKEIGYSKFYEGLQEPLGLLQHQGWLYVAQRGELSRLRDEDGDGRADVLETVCDAWTISGNYHEYNFGPHLGPNGQLWITTNKPFGDEPFGRAHWRGFALSIDPETGAMTPVACGLRSPCGIGFGPNNDLFFTDNQGEWCGASKLSHIEAGDFHGHPHGLFSCEEDAWKYPIPAKPAKSTKMGEVKDRIPSFKMPAVWFPYDKMGKSPAGFVTDRSEGRFGPFAGQLFVTDQHHASVMRVDLEKVDGHWQGACFPFREGLQCGAIRAMFSPDGRSLLVGQTNRGWGSKGSKSFGLERITWTGATPFEIQQLRLAKPIPSQSGQGLVTFTAKLTEAVDPMSASDPSAYRVSSYTYLLHKRYGSPEVDTKKVPVHSVSVAKDGRSISLHMEASRIRKNYVHEFDFSGLRSVAGKPLLHTKAYYTLVKLPKSGNATETGDPVPPSPAKRRSDFKLLSLAEQNAPLSEPRPGNQWITLFDGQTLDGWHNPYAWGKVEVVDREIHLRGNRKWFLATKKRWADFEFEADVHVPIGGNSGFMFRCHVKPNRVFGYQAEVDTSDRQWSGGIYDEGRRAWVAPVKDSAAQAALKRGEWNHYRIRVVGDHIQTWVNSIPVSDFHDALDLEGHFALQHHGEKGKLYRFRNIRVKPLGRHVWKPLNGNKDLGALTPRQAPSRWQDSGSEIRFDPGDSTAAEAPKLRQVQEAEWPKAISARPLRMRYRSQDAHLFWLGLKAQHDAKVAVCLGNGALRSTPKSTPGFPSVPFDLLQPKAAFAEKHYRRKQWNTLHIHWANGQMTSKLNGHLSVVLPKSQSVGGELRIGLTCADSAFKDAKLVISAFEILTPEL